MCFNPFVAHTITTRRAGEDDPPVMARVLAAVRDYYPERFVAGLDLDVARLAALMQTGNAFLVAEVDGEVRALVRIWDDEGIAWFDLLASDFPGAGRALVGAIERGAQDRGLRLARTRIPEEEILIDYFARRGYTGILREGENDAALLVIEKRLPLLTVREQRRSDAEAIARLTGEDPWFFEQMPRPGWFVASDGDRVVGVISVRDGGGGLAQLREPVLLPGYEGRGLEAWMIDRAAYYAETNGYHTAEVPLTPRTRPLQRALEDRRWSAERDAFVRRFRTPPPPGEWQDER